MSEKEPVSPRTARPDPAPRIPKMTHHKASGRAVVRLDGHDRYLGPWGTRQARCRYRQVISEWLAAMDADGEPVETISILTSLYWRHVTRRYRKDGRLSSEAEAQRVAVRFLNLYADLPVVDFGPRKLKACRQAMIDAKLTRKSINRMVGRIRQVFNWAAENEFIDQAHPHRLTCVRPLQRNTEGVEESPEIQPVDPARVQAIEPHVSQQVWSIVNVQLLTAMRGAEVMSMRAVDLDMTGDVWIYTLLDDKTRHRRQDEAKKVAVGPRAQVFILPLLTADATKYIFSPADAEAHRQTERRRRRRVKVYPRQDALHAHRRPRRPKRRPGARYTKDSYRQAIQRACLKAGVMPWSPHQLRHARITELGQEFSLEAARAVAGHKSVKTTLIYTARDLALAVEVARKIG